MISVENLSYTYGRSARPAIRNLSFEIRPGEIFGFLGPSGAGKSTTQKILIGLLRGYTGHVSIFGRPLTSWKADFYERIGVAFELPNHFLKLTGLENLRYFGSLYDRPTLPPHVVLALVGLAADAETPVSQYSKGMKTRLSIARALQHEPELLFLDEPTSGLDPVTAHMVKELIRRQQEAGRTVFLTTHDMSVADALCDRVAFVMDGEINVIDTPRKLKLDHGRATVRVEYQEEQRGKIEEFGLCGLHDNLAFWQLLRDCEVQTIHSQEATLEEVFIRVTGRKLQ